MVMFKAMVFVCCANNLINGEGNGDSYGIGLLW